MNSIVFMQSEGSVFNIQYYISR